MRGEARRRDAMQCRSYARSKRPTRSTTHSKRARLTKVTRRKWLREDSNIQQSEQIPFRTRLGLEVPKDPTLTIQLKDIQLRLDEVSHIIPELLAPRLDEIDGFARPAEGAAGKGAIVAGADAVAVEGGGAVGHSGGPLADDEPLVTVLGVGGDVVADKLSVLGGRQGGEVVIEDLVFVMVDDDVLSVIVRGTEESVPGLNRGKTIAEYDRGVADLADVVETVAIVLLGARAAARNVGEKGLIEQLDSDHHILVSWNGIFLGDLGDDVIGKAGCVAGRPFGGAGTLTGVVKAVLRERCSYKIVKWILNRKSIKGAYHVDRSKL